ncbi:hypothetical protein O6H91_15G005200 [Diphasiastrum complanatum]|uniref:Uncharacterized protein n=1 Tax=Diphasiastrum complanatum TaxID=34168 RepID=A0ACC2BF92_DIPCM|nr:hypothetical protein O6H91_15G005200 [Diphasiastrum complanatum]
MDARSEKKSYPLVSTDYELLEEVGQGVSAIVYRAICTPFKEVVAIKSLDMERCNSSLDDIRREAQTMSLIDHPNVVKAYCSFMVGQFLWVVMPYMAGGSCLHIMQAAFPDGFDEPVIATLLRETLKALEYLHRNGHIHRDVKAGNILVAENGGVKLGDFGVSACMFDRGDRQRSRITFVGTPCWMAPEVMEQLHGYNFKADIWSFGITALELAHGHAPFSKYPPMKVLLMTLQNAPPGLDYERDKRFSKSFKEMIAMCLVKDPAKRPSAEKLLKHSFFKHAKSGDYITRHVLGGLPPLWERVKALKVKDAARLAQNKMPFGEQEERSQNEYKRGVSGWNFDVEDLKAQAALIQDDEPHAHMHGDETLTADACNSNDISEICLDQSSSCSSPVAGKPSTGSQGCKSSFMYKVENKTEGGECLTRIRSGPLPTHTQFRPVNGPKHVKSCILHLLSRITTRSAPLPFGKKEPKLIGRFNVFEEEMGNGNSGCCGDKPVANQQRRYGSEYEIDDLLPQSECERQSRRVERLSPNNEVQRRLTGSKGLEREWVDGRRSSSGPLLPCHVIASHRGQEDARERDHQQGCRSPDYCSRDDARQRERGCSPLTSNGALLDCWVSNGLCKSSGYKDPPEEKFKVPLIQKKGRFSVTSEDRELNEDNYSIRRNGSAQAFSQSLAAPQLSLPNGSSNTVPVTAILPHLQSLCSHVAIQQDIIMNLMSSLNSGEHIPGQRLNQNGSKLSARNLQSWSEREHSLLHQLAELQVRIATLTDELQAAKLRNVQLERQLNAIFSKEEGRI